MYNWKDFEWTLAVVSKMVIFYSVYLLPFFYLLSQKLTFFKTAEDLTHNLLAVYTIPFCLLAATQHMQIAETALFIFNEIFH